MLFQQISKFDPKRTTFGRHQTFSLRYGWLTKGFQAITVDQGIFNSEAATVELGVGKNMVDAIKYWLQAGRLVEYRSLTPTTLGEAIFDAGGYDPYLEDEGTLWLVHWLLASNPMLATTLFWFFNRYHKPEFTAQELLQSLMAFTEDMQINIAEHTLKQDTSILIRMYVASVGDKRTPLEEALDSPLALLDLVTPYAHTTDRRYQSRSTERPDLPCEIVGYALHEILQAKAAASIALEELLHTRSGYPALGSIFRLSETGLLAKLEELVKKFPQYYEFRETAGIQQIYQLNTPEPLDFLQRYYTSDT